LLLTRGNPLSNAENVLAGLDFRYRNDRVFGDQVLTADAWLQRSSQSGGGIEGSQEWAVGGLLRYPNDRFDAALGFAEFGRDFTPGLGFVNRPGIRDHLAEFHYRVRPGCFVRTVDTGFNFNFVTDLHNEIESGTLRFDLFDMENDPGDQASFKVLLRRERLVEPFEIEDGVVIPEGTYDFDRYRIAFESSRARPVSLALELEVGDFYTGERISILPTLELRPSPHLFVALEYEEERVRLPEGNFDARVGRIAVDVRFNADLFWTTLTQYDNLSKRLGIQSRLRWIVAPERELHFVVEHGMDHRDGRPLRSTLSRLTAKVQWSLRF